MVEGHGDAGRVVRQGRARIALRLRDQPGLEQQLVALQDALLVPRAAVHAEGQAEAVQAAGPRGAILGLGRPFGEPRLDGVELARAPLPEILVGQVAVPVLPRGLGDPRRPLLADERQVGHRERVHPRQGRRAGAVAVAEGVELLHVAEALVRLPLHPGAQAALQRGVLGDEGTGRQAVAAAGRLVRDPDRQGARLPLGRGDDHRDEAYGGALRRGLPPARVRLRRGTRHRSSTVRPPGCAVADPAYRGAGSPRVNAAV